MEKDNGGNQHVAYQSNSDGCDGTEQLVENDDLEQMVGKDKGSEMIEGEESKIKRCCKFTYIMKTVCRSLLGTLLMKNNSKNTSNAQVNLKKLNIRRVQWLRQRGNKWNKPHPKYLLTDDHRKLFCQFIKDVKLPDEFGSNISKRVTDNNSNIPG
ncbi:hypothetical protein LXL04_029298 [Taraxacum kok-saghyz]